MTIAQSLIIFVFDVLLVIAIFMPIDKDKTGDFFE